MRYDALCYVEKKRIFFLSPRKYLHLNYIFFCVNKKKIVLVKKGKYSISMICFSVKLIESARYGRDESRKVERGFKCGKKNMLPFHVGTYL